MNRASLTAVCLGEQTRLCLSAAVLNISCPTVMFHPSKILRALSPPESTSLAITQKHPLCHRGPGCTVNTLMIMLLCLPLCDPQRSSCPAPAGPGLTDQRTRSQSKVDIIADKPVISLSPSVIVCASLENVYLCLKTI